MCNDGKEYAPPWKSWLTTAGLVFLGVTLGALVAASLVAPGPPRSAHEELARPVEPQPPKPSGSPGPPAHQGPGAKAPGFLLPLTGEGQGVRAVGPPRSPANEARPAGAAPSPGQTPVPPGESSAGPLTHQAPTARQGEPPASAQINFSPEKPQAEDALKRAAFARAALAARIAMADRNLAAARRQLETAAANAQDQADQTQLERLQIIHENLAEFWKGVHAAVAKLQPVEELELKDTRVVVVEASRDELTVHVYGRNQSYRVEAMPMPLISAICKQAFARTPGSKIIVGTFLAMDRQGDRREARQLWQEAANAGEQQPRQLMPELDVPIPPTGRRR